MKFNIETERLILREFRPEDAEGIFRLDSDPRVMLYLGNKTISGMNEAEDIVAGVRKQYEDHGIGRWVVMERSSGNFIGWSGLKFITYTENNQTNFHDVGYRLLPGYWGRGYATESARAALEYGFKTMGLHEIIGMCDEKNLASRRALEKCGLKFVEKFNHKNIICDWLSIKNDDWNNQIQK